jgi:hypothetical protein
MGASAPSLYLTEKGSHQMSKGRANYMTKAEARRLYEEDGESYAAIGRKLDYKGITVSGWAKADGGWVKPGAKVEGEPVYEDSFMDDQPTVGTEATYEPTSPRVTAGSEAELRARIKELEAENDRLSPTRDIHEMLKDRVQWLTDNSPEGERYWLNRAEAEFKSENLDRAKQGLPTFDVKDHPEILDDLIVQLKTKEAMGQTGEPGDVPTRRVKLFIIRNGMPTIEPIPMENQINNMAGSLADGIVRYTRKGFKLTDPFLCPRAGCYRPAASDEAARWLYDGYCTDKHRVEVEGEQESPTVGLNVRDTVLSGI